MVHENNFIQDLLWQGIAGPFHVASAEQIQAILKSNLSVSELRSQLADLCFDTCIKIAEAYGEELVCFEHKDGSFSTKLSFCWHVDNMSARVACGREVGLPLLTLHLALSASTDMNCLQMAPGTHTMWRKGSWLLVHFAGVREPFFSIFESNRIELEQIYKTCARSLVLIPVAGLLWLISVCPPLLFALERYVEALRTLRVLQRVLSLVFCLVHGAARVAGFEGAIFIEPRGSDHFAFMTPPTHRRNVLLQPGQCIVFDNRVMHRSNVTPHSTTRRTYKMRLAPRRLIKQPQHGVVLQPNNTSKHFEICAFSSE